MELHPLRLPGNHGHVGPFPVTSRGVVGTPSTVAVSLTFLVPRDVSPSCCYGVCYRLVSISHWSLSRLRPRPSETPSDVCVLPGEVEVQESQCLCRPRPPVSFVGGRRRDEDSRGRLQVGPRKRSSLGSPRHPSYTTPSRLPTPLPPQVVSSTQCQPRINNSHRSTHNSQCVPQHVPHPRLNTT